MDKLTYYEPEHLVQDDCTLQDALDPDNLNRLLVYLADWHYAMRREGPCLVGRVYNHPLFPDGQVITTSPYNRIDLHIEEGGPLESHVVVNPGRAFCRSRTYVLHGLPQKQPMA